MSALSFFAPRSLPPDLAAAPCVALGILLAGVRRLPRLHHALQPLEDG